MGGQPCKAKAILNGATIESEARSLCYQIQQAKDLPDAEGYQIVSHLNHAENLIFAAKRVFLESQGFHGPWPKSMAEPGD